ncbi:hypothetical protein H6P81_002098 [Aristolochia fimbriata]|uniref:Uncharacterized protein n=1 Tax=Aristolochia fimbriata TaxID=158543 RepID=A0AAV7F8T6_ARIFI|nr:hypothetical protein H6P81_002098 [Aristolochia fimbriata]
MAGYSYNGGSSERRLGVRFPERDHTYDNGGSKWSQPSYAAKDDSYRDHVCRPIVVDAEGKAIPGVFILPNQPVSDAYVTKSERIVEHVHSPDGYTISSATKGEIVRDYADPKSGWSTKEAYMELTPGVNQYIGMNKKGGLPRGLFQRKTPFPRTYGGSYETGNKEYDTQYSLKYDTVHQPKQEVYHGKDNGRHETGMKGRSTPKYDNLYQPNHESYPHKDERRLDDPYSTTTHSSVGSGFNRVPPARNHESPITKPTNDVGALANYLKEAAKTTVTVAPQQGYLSAPKQTYDTGDYVKEPSRTPLVNRSPQQGRPLVSPVPYKIEPSHETIDSREAERRYGTLPNPVPKVDKSQPTIDSKRAAQMYEGTFIPV